MTSSSTRTREREHTAADAFGSGPAPSSSSTYRRSSTTYAAGGSVGGGGGRSHRSSDAHRQPSTHHTQGARDARTGGSPYGTDRESRRDALHHSSAATAAGPSTGSSHGAWRASRTSTSSVGSGAAEYGGATRSARDVGAGSGAGSRARPLPPADTDRSHSSRSDSARELSYGGEEDRGGRVRRGANGGVRSTPSHFSPPPPPSPSWNDSGREMYARGRNVGAVGDVATRPAERYDDVGLRSNDAAAAAVRDWTPVPQRGVSPSHRSVGPYPSVDAWSTWPSSSTSTSMPGAPASAPLGPPASLVPLPSSHAPAVGTPAHAGTATMGPAVTSPYAAAFPGAVSAPAPVSSTGPVPSGHTNTSSGSSGSSGSGSSTAGLSEAWYSNASARLNAALHTCSWKQLQTLRDETRGRVVRSMTPLLRDLLLTICLKVDQKLELAQANDSVSGAVQAYARGEDAGGEGGETPVPLSVNDSQPSRVREWQRHAEDMKAWDEHRRREFLLQFLRSQPHLLYFLDQWLTLELGLWSHGMGYWMPKQPPLPVLDPPNASSLSPTAPPPTTSSVTTPWSPVAALPFAGIRPEILAVDLVEAVADRLVTALYFQRDELLCGDVVDHCVQKQVTGVSVDALAQCMDRGLTLLEESTARTHNLWPDLTRTIPEWSACRRVWRGMVPRGLPPLRVSGPTSKVSPYTLATEASLEVALLIRQALIDDRLARQQSANEWKAFAQRQTHTNTILANELGRMYQRLHALVESRAVTATPDKTAPALVSAAPAHPPVVPAPSVSPPTAIAHALSGPNRAPPPPGAARTGPAPAEGGVEPHAPLASGATSRVHVLAPPPSAGGLAGPSASTAIRSNENHVEVARPPVVRESPDVPAPTTALARVPERPLPAPPAASRVEGPDSFSSHSTTHGVGSAGGRNTYEGRDEAPRRLLPPPAPAPPSAPKTMHDPSAWATGGDYPSHASLSSPPYDRYDRDGYDGRYDSPQQPSYSPSLRTASNESFAPAPPPPAGVRYMAPARTGHGSPSSSFVSPAYATRGTSEDPRDFHEESSFRHTRQNDRRDGTDSGGAGERWPEPRRMSGPPPREYDGRWNSEPVAAPGAWSAAPYEEYDPRDRSRREPSPPFRPAPVAAYDSGRGPVARYETDVMAHPNDPTSGSPGDMSRSRAFTGALSSGDTLTRPRDPGGTQRELAERSSNARPPSVLPASRVTPGGSAGVPAPAGPPSTAVDGSASSRGKSHRSRTGQATPTGAVSDAAYLEKLRAQFSHRLPNNTPPS